ncbi:MAG TPA: lipopolysaccharide assembly protein LapA domain-containing protein [Gammaproteobacteria bacterium]
MATIRRLTYVVIAVLFILAALIFAYGNPDPISVDIGFARFENVSMTVAFVFAFGLGWLFGLVCAGLALLRMARERRDLRRDLRFAEAELSGLRALPLQDAN